MKVTFIVPCFNAVPNLPALIQSLRDQSDSDWTVVFIDDLSVDGTYEYLHQVSGDGFKIGQFTILRNTEKKFALRNIVETARTLGDRSNRIIAVIDGDDQLCNPDTIKLLKEAHSQPGMVVWTAHRWDINGMNISKDMPSKVNPYQHPWCSSHLRTFDASLLKQISDANFKDHEGKWFERGYDQALMLPLLAKASARKYLPDVCYLYKIDSCSVKDRDWAELKQLRTVNMVRSRGFVDG